MSNNETNSATYKMDVVRLHRRAGIFREARRGMGVYAMLEGGGMSEQQEIYDAQGDNAAEIHPPKTIQAIRDSGLVEYKVWGWVKISAKFISHIKRLRGAKLSIWQVLACSIDEYGKCSLTIKELCELTGYSHTEIINSLRELDEMGYLSIDRSGKKNLYTPEFAARGTDKNPSETLVKKLDSTPVYQVESSPSLEKSDPSIKELKELIDIRFSKIQKSLEKIGILLTSTDPWKIDTWMEKHTDEKIQKAIDIAQARGVRNLAYVNTILAGWFENGYPEEKKTYKSNKSDQPSPLEKYAASIGAI
jgi:DnaD/phage-associated family protein